MSRQGPDEELRRIFREELEDHAVTFEAKGRALAAHPADPVAIARELFRAAHSAKGAARAVGESRVEVAFDALESRLSAALEAENVEVDALAAMAVRAAEAVRTYIRTGDPGALVASELAKAPAAAPGAPAAFAAQTASTSLEAALREGASSATEPAETLRVPFAKIASLSDAAEELLAAVARAPSDAWAEADAALTLRTDLLRVQQLAHRHRDRDLSNGIERALSSLQTLRVVHAAEGERAATWLRSVVSGARAVGADARSLRLVTLASLRPLLERTASDAAAACGKEASLQWGDGPAEVDRRIRDGIRDVLLQLIRNAIDHGLEAPSRRREIGKPSRGTVAVDAAVLGRTLRVVVRDDGGGIDVDRVRARAEELGVPEDLLGDPVSLVFEPGLSTRSEVGAISGRGVGLDVVRQRVAELHGRIDVTTRRGEGTSFVISVPVELGVLRSLAVRCGDTQLVLPSTSVLRVRAISPSDVRTVEGREYVEEDGAVLPVIELVAALGLPRTMRAAEPKSVPAVVVASGERRGVFLVDALLDERDVIVRRPPIRVRRLLGVAGVCILEEGDVALVVDAAAVLATARARSASAGEASTTAEQARKVLVVDDSVTTRQLMRSLLESAGYEVAVAPDGEQAWTMLSSAAFDLVVSDVDMPRMDGFSLLARIRSTARLSTLPVVLVTALERDADRARAAQLDASAYLTKGGFDQDELLDTLERLSR